MSDAGLFSIDVDAHLKKAASHSFGSSGHYPVEMVRSALQRGASQVDIHLTAHQLQILDNGPGLETAAIDTLITLMDPSRPEARKEEAVESIQTREGMGLLAIFAANPEEILVENVTPAGSLRLHLKKNQFDKSPAVASTLTAGTRITLIGGHRDINQEKVLLEAFCRSVRQEVRLNHRPLGGNPFLSGQIATAPLSPSKYASGGQVGVPQTGSICHIRLLDQGIPWHHFTLPPQEGYIFDAAVETTEEATRELIDHLCRYGYSLYRWLGNRYTGSDPVSRERIEELLYTHCRQTNDETLVLQYARFNLYDYPGSLDLGQVRKKAAAGSLYAVPRGKEHLSYHTAHKTVLSLTREQADLLINHLKIPLVFLHPVVHRPSPFPRLWYKFKKNCRRLFLHLMPTPKTVIPDDRLSKPEQLLIFTLARYLSGESEYLLSPSPGIKVFLVASRGPFPALLSGRGKKKLLVRRHHPLVRKALQAVQADPRNIEMYAPLLID